MTETEDQASSTGTTTLRRQPRRAIVERVIAADPAFSRLRLAARALLAMMVTGVVLAGVTWFRPLPPAVYGLSAIMVFIGTLAVRDPTPQRQAGTRAFAGLAGIASATLAGALSAWPGLAGVVFLTVIFTSVYIRRFRLRWTTVGVIAFMAYFMGDYLRPQPADIGWLALGAGVALLTTHLMRTAILPENPERDFRRAMRTLDHRINVILLHLLDAARAGEVPKTSRDTFRTEMAQLRNVVLMAEGFIPQTGNGNWQFDGPARDLATALFDLQMAVERLVRHRHVSPPTPDALAELLDQTGHRLSHNAGAPLSLRRGSPLVDQIGAARSRMNAILGTSPSPAFALQALTPPLAPTPAKPADGKGGVPTVWRRPIQVTVACGIAMLAGSLLSPRLWFWAVITAYVVFNNTKARADTTMRAAERSAGTLGGVAIGTLIATALHGHMVASAALIPVLFFLAFYFLRVS